MLEISYEYRFVPYTTQLGDECDYDVTMRGKYQEHTKVRSYCVILSIIFMKLEVGCVINAI
jgi:hypothetical protein